jgi:hypothetical protein
MKTTDKKQGKPRPQRANKARNSATLQPALSDIEPAKRQMTNVRGGTKSFHPIASCW